MNPTQARDALTINPKLALIHGCIYEILILVMRSKTYKSAIIVDTIEDSSTQKHQKVAKIHSDQPRYL
jgi:hypothetical protein